jgi:hypothetical protein
MISYEGIDLDVAVRSDGRVILRLSSVRDPNFTAQLVLSTETATWLAKDLTVIAGRLRDVGVAQP